MEYGVDLSKKVNEIVLVSAIVLAVAHKRFNEWSSSQCLKRLQAEGVVMDVKEIVPREELAVAGIRIWGL